MRCSARSLRVAAGPSMLVEPKGKDSFKEISEEVEGDPLKKTIGNMTPSMAKVCIPHSVPI